VAPFIVLYTYRLFGSWLALTGCLGMIWVLLWLRFYRAPQHRARVSPAELAYIQEGRPIAQTASAARWRDLLGYPQAWDIILGRLLLDPFWFFISEWFALYLYSKGFHLAQSVLGFWMPFLGADLGNFAGGALSSYWISRGWQVGRARRTVLLIFGPSMAALLLVLRTSTYFEALLVFAYASFAYASCSTMFLSLPTDVFHPRALGTVAGMAGTGAGIGTMISTYLIGRVTDATSFTPVITAAAIVPCAATAVFLILVRAPQHPDPHGLRLDF
jgi:ACS family hexuronate transporter-like MFS transporter